MTNTMKIRKIDDTDLRDILINPELNRRGQYICDCPFCGKERHFYISKETQMFDCKKCGEYGSIIKLLKFLGKTYLLGGSTIEDKDTIISLSQMIEKVEESEEVKMLPKVSMPVGFKVFRQGNRYLEDRGVSAEECRRYGIGGTNLLSKYKNYILIPIRDNGEIRGYVGRYAAKKVPEDKLRYNNSTGTNFAELMFGYDEIVSGKTECVILVEGIFDKIAVDRVLHLWQSDEIKCVCTFGKKISQQQIFKLLLKLVNKVILLYDFDALKEIKKFGLELENYFQTSITFTTKKDIDECSESEALEVFAHLRKPCEFNVDIIGKLRK